ncbi:hypothetical protein [Flavobacterium sp. GCM10027622]|uniref:hypothetical protein n=1 Tax=unclassified Flavobacterium TaxID=196869 RepID=UPI003621116B
MDKEAIEILKNINKSLAEINVREQTREMFAESEKVLEKTDRRVEDSTNQIQNTFDRIHDKVFNFNNILIGAFLVLGTYPGNAPILKLWTIVFPIFNLIYKIVLDVEQMGIHRFAANQKEWEKGDMEEYGKRINRQTLRSLFSFFLSFCCLMYLIYCVVF